MNISVIKYTFKYVLVNKPAGIKCEGHTAQSLLPQVTKFFKSLRPDAPLDPKRFKVVQRLDRYVTGGMLVSRDEKFTKRVNKALAKKDSGLSLTRRYVGLLPVTVKEGELKMQFKAYKIGPAEGYKGLVFEDTSLSSGSITFDVESLERDSKDGTLVKKPSRTRFRLLRHLAKTPSSAQVAAYPDLFASVQLLPVVFELDTGRKNQLRDHTIHAFNTPLLNDDTFSAFKMVPATHNSSNSVAYKSNQVGLHSAYVKMVQNGTVKEEHFIPVQAIEDRDLWHGFVDENGELLECIKEVLADPWPAT